MVAWLQTARESLARAISSHSTPLSAEAMVLLGVTYPSQCGQDLWVIETLAGLRGGYFVDAGASNGVVSSNTWALERTLGWRGVCIEANPAFFRTLVRHRRVTCIDAVLWDVDHDEVDFLPDGACGGVVSEHTGIAAPAGHAHRRRTRSLVSILREVGAPSLIDYLSIDVEGAETRILAGFPFDEFSFRLMTIERPSTALHAVIEAQGFRRVREIFSPEGKPVDSFYIHRSVLGADETALRPRPLLSLL